MSEATDLISGDALKAAAQRFLGEVRAKIDQEQGGLLIAEVQMQHPRVHFYKGDCSSPDTLFPGDLLQTAPHPWLVVEDAHHNVSGVLDLLHHFLIPGDYLVVEDSDVKRDAIRAFVDAHPGDYLVDTRFTDNFGRNATCAADSIFVRVGKGASDVAADQDETIMTHNGSNQIQLPLGDSDARQRLLQPSGRRRALDRSRLFRPR